MTEAIGSELGDPIGQARQHGGIAYSAPNDPDRPNPERHPVDSDMDLAPDAMVRPSVLARMPVALAPDLVAGLSLPRRAEPDRPRAAITQRGSVSGPVRSAMARAGA